MITVNVKQLVSALDDADAFSMPEMSGGTRYVYDELYGRLSRGEDLRLSEIDFARFDLDDIDAMRTLYSGTLVANERGAERLTRILRSIQPVPALTAFV